MDKSMRRRLGLEKSPMEQFHDELFKKTTEYDYYLLGMAQGIFHVYSTFKYLNSKNINLTAEESMKVIKEGVEPNDVINKYFKKFVDDLEDDESKKD